MYSLFTVRYSLLRPRQNGRFPEIDRAAWFDPATAQRKINPAQAALITELTTRI